MSYEDGMPAGGNSRFRNYSARVSERQQLALIMQMTSQEMTSGSSNRSESTIPLSNVRSSPLQHQKNSKNRWSNKNADLLDVNTSYNRQDDRLRLANGCDSKDRGEFAGSNSPDEVRTASEAESPRAAGSPAECAATATSTSTSASSNSADAAAEQQQQQQQQLQDQQQPSQEQQHLEPREMRRTPPQNKVDRQASGQQQHQQQQQQQQSGGGGGNAGNNSGGNSARVTLRATRDEKKGTSVPGTNVAGTATAATGQTSSNSSSSCNNASSSRQAASISAAAAAGSTSLNYNQTAMDSSAGKSSSNSGNTSGSGVSGSASTGNSGSVSGGGPAGSSGNAPNSSSSSSSSADGGDVYEFKSSKEATPVRGSSSSPNPNPDKDGKDSNSSLATSTSNTQIVSSAVAESNAAGQGSAVVGSSTGVSSSVSSTNTSAVTGSSSSSTGGTGGTLAEAMSTSTTDDQPQSSSASGSASGASSTSVKRPFDSDNGPGDEQDEEGRKRKKKETETGKDVGAKGAASRQAASRNNPSASDKIKQTGSRQIGGLVNTKSNQGNNSASSDRKSPSITANSPKPSNSSVSNTNNPKGNTPSATESDGEDERSKNSDSNSAPKVPPLKIVIPQSTVSEQEQGNRNGKNNSNRGHQLPYVVASSNSNDSMDKEQGMSVVTSGTTSPIDNSGAASKTDEKKDLGGALDGGSNGPWHSHQRVLRSSHRSGNGANGSSSGNSSNMSGNGNFSNHSPLPANAADRSNNSSPQQRYLSPTPESVASETGKAASADSSIQNSPAPKSNNVIEKGDVKVEVKKELVDSTEINIKKEPGSESSNTSSQQSVELHPRKRKMKPNKENQQSTSSSTGTSETTEAANTVPEIHPHDQPITNCYQLFLNIRKQIDKKRKGLFPVQPKPPQGFKDYLMNRCTYVLAGNANKEPTVNFPINLPAQMKDLYVQQEQVRHRLRMQHVVEKEKLVLSVEQEILRVHGKAARALANQSLPFSACTFLKDEEVYNVITPEQEEKDRNARSRYNGRLFLSWLQDVDDKWEKIKEGMLLRHHNEAESLHAVQRMDWEWKLKEVQLCEFKATPQIEDSHVPMVHVSDDFDLLPA